MSDKPPKGRLTGSSYVGDNNACGDMHGFGIYNYPDGSEYRGFFEKGNFHGFGFLKLAHPGNCTLQGLFHKGDLIEIKDMYFDDGLRLNGTYAGDKVDMNEWFYGSQKERRFIDEMKNGIEPVGPTAPQLTRNKTERKIHRGCYDVEEGIFMPSTGFIFQREKPLSATRFVGCKQELDWIVQNCRKSSTTAVNVANETLMNTKFLHKIEQEIIDSNVSATQHSDGHLRCNCLKLTDKMAYADKLCREERLSLTKTCCDNSSSESNMSDNNSVSEKTTQATPLTSVRDMKSSEHIEPIVSVKSMIETASSHSIIDSFLSRHSMTPSHETASSHSIIDRFLSRHSMTPSERSFSANYEFMGDNSFCDEDIESASTPFKHSMYSTTNYGSDSSASVQSMIESELCRKESASTPFRHSMCSTTNYGSDSSASVQSMIESESYREEFTPTTSSTASQRNMFLARHFKHLSTPSTSSGTSFSNPCMVEILPSNLNFQIETSSSRSEESLRFYFQSPRVSALKRESEFKEHRSSNESN